MEFDARSFPEAIRSLFELNQYIVQGPSKLHGAEIDLVARPTTGPFDVSIYVEATVELVDNAKYGKDLTKLALFREAEPEAQLLIVSSKGFTKEVKERAQATRIHTMTYSELFSKFERFQPYIDSMLDPAGKGKDAAALATIYEEPTLSDAHGNDVATEYLTHWRDNPSPHSSWLIVTGEYGTGKTALTRVLQHRWLHDYRLNPRLPLPFRIELRDFSRQFDANGLLHHFLDHNELPFLPLPFVLNLIRSGRIVLILDGYDEMAQYLHARERRACLEALSTLSADGARGILTSRPNYFTESEELHVFETLYATLKQERYVLGKEDRLLLDEEARIDKLLEQFAYRFERILQDLSPAQTEALVRRVLKDDLAGQDVILALLRRIFRETESGASVSLSGKPVIISYLLEVIEALKEEEAERDGELLTSADKLLTEWEVYRLIINKLMLRDLKRSPDIGPDERRRFLQRLSVMLSTKAHASLSESDFRDLVAKEFAGPLRRVFPEDRQQELERLFADLRSSTTLTRSSDPSRAGWRFSHNSLREYLATELLTVRLDAGEPIAEEIVISDAMRVFAASRSEPDRGRLLTRLAWLWKQDPAQRGLGQLLCLLWDAMIPLFAAAADPVRETFVAVAGSHLRCNGVRLQRLVWSAETKQTDLSGAAFAGAALTEIVASYASLKGCDFSDSVLESIRFDGADLQTSTFARAVIVDVAFTGANVKGADFRGVSPEYVSIVAETPQGERRLEGLAALGYLRYSGAITDPVPNAYVYSQHPKFEIIQKIVGRLSEQTIRQRRGLEQRGPSQQDVPFSRALVAEFERAGWLRTQVHRKDLVEVTPEGREVFGAFGLAGRIPDEIEAFLSAYSSRP